MPDTSLAPETFVSSLPSLAPSLHAAPTAAVAAPADQPDKTPSASVAGNSMVAFTANLDATHKTELLYVMGWAQLHAVQTYNQSPQTNPIGYYNAVTGILTRVGFTAQNVAFTSYTAKTATVELDQVVLEIVGGLLTAPELALVDAAVAALKASASDNGAPWTIYSSSSTTNNAGSFSIGLADETTAPDGTQNVSLSLSAFSFTGTESNQRFLWASYSSTSIAIQTGGTGLVLNDALWNSKGVGAAITAQMQAASAGYIANLPPLKP